MTLLGVVAVSVGAGLGDCFSGDFLIDDGVVVDERRYQQADHQVVHRSGIAAESVVDQLTASAENRVSTRPAILR